MSEIKPTSTIEEIREIMNERYSSGQAYKASILWDKVRAEELNKHVMEIISPTENKNILELGCGEGGTAPYIKDCKKYVGIDISDVAVNIAIKNFGRENFTFLQMDATDPQFKNNSFDIVIAKEVIEHLLDVEKAVKEVYRILKKGGLFVVTSPNRDSLHLRINRMLGNVDFKCSYDHIRELSFTEFKDILTRHNFTITETRGCFLMPYWGIPNIDIHVRHLTDNDPEMIELLRKLGELAGAEYAFCYIVAARK